MPCGVLRPSCRGVIGNGVVLDPMAFLQEVGKLRELGIDVDRQLFISNRAQVILPYHRMIELAAESAPGRQKIGTTSRGIGPAYEDKMARSGLRVVDLLNTSLLRTHIQNACHEKNAIAHALFGTDPLDPQKMYEEYAPGGWPDCAIRHRYRGAAEHGDPCGTERHVRRGPGNAAGYRPWDLSFCDFIFGDSRRRGHGDGGSGRPRSAP